MKNLKKKEMAKDEIISLEAEEVTDERLMVEIMNNMFINGPKVPTKPRNFTWEDVNELYNEIEDEDE